MSNLTIRARVAVWYGVVTVGVLVVVAVAISLVYQRIALGRLDLELADAARTLDGVVINELRETGDLSRAARGALRELTLPGIGQAILATDGQILASGASGVAALPAVELGGDRGAAPRTLPHWNVRVATSTWQHGEASYSIVTWAPLEPLARERATLQNTMRVAIPLAAVVAMLGGWLIARWALRPLTAMAADATGIDHRQLDRRLVSPPARDELGRLGSAFNALLDRLAMVVRAQRRFMAEASHELRTPVSIALTAAQVTLANPSRSEIEYRESLEIIAAQMRRLTRVVGDMFMLALADLNARPLEPSELYLNEIVSDCVRAATVLARPRDVVIRLRGEAADMPARGDEGLLRQLVMNLLDNAIRHTPAGGHVDVTLRHAGEQAELTVEDSGPGVPVADQARVFERFVRLGPPGASGGAGLGLAIAQWVAEQHGGTLNLAGGDRPSSRFVLTLPTAAPHVSAAM